jgi:hypothetical protein
LKKIIFFIFALLLLLPKLASADVYTNLQALDGAAFIAGRSMHKKKSTLTTVQSYEACKIFMLAYNKKLSEKNGNPNYKSFLHYMSPAEVTYCWTGYINTKGLFKLDEVNYLLGKSLYSKIPHMSAKRSYIDCERDSFNYNKKLSAKNGNPNYKIFLMYALPAEYTYCWVGYLDAAGGK